MNADEPHNHHNLLKINSNFFSSDKKAIDLEKPMRCGAFVDRNRIPQYTEQDYNLPETPPFSWLLRKPKSETENKTDDEKLSKSENDENASPNNNNLSSRIAEASKLSQSPKDNISGTSPSSLKSRWSVRENKEDDKLLKELVSFDEPRVTLAIFIKIPLFPFSAFPLCQSVTHRRSREILPRVFQRTTIRVVFSRRHRSDFWSSRKRNGGWRFNAAACRVRDFVEWVWWTDYVALRVWESKQQLKCVPRWTWDARQSGLLTSKCKCSFRVNFIYWLREKRNC